MIQLQRQLKDLLKGKSEFRNTRKGARVVTKEMADSSAISSHFESNNLLYLTFCPKSQKPIRAVIRHFPVSIPVEGISDELAKLGFDVINIKQMSTNCRSPAEGTTTAYILLFVITLPRTSKPHEIFNLARVCRIAIRIETYMDKTGLAQCYNCKKFGYVWANCKQPSLCMWCVGGHLHKECPEKEKYSIDGDMLPLKVGGRRGTSSLRLSRLQARQGSAAKDKAAESAQDYKGRVFSSSHTTPGLQVSFAAVLRSNTTIAAASATLSFTGLPRHSGRNESSGPLRHNQQVPSQTVQASNAKSSSLYDVFTVVATTFEQLLTKLNGAESEQDKIRAITKIVLKLKKKNDH
jgi:hypothetical protein